MMAPPYNIETVSVPERISSFYSLLWIRHCIYEIHDYKGPFGSIEPVSTWILSADRLEGFEDY